MAVPVDHDLESGSFRFQVELRKIVQDIDGNPADLDDFGLRQLARPCSLIDIAANRCDRRKGCERVENFGIAYVAGMNNALTSAQCLERFRPKQAMSFGDDANEDGGLSSQFWILSSQFSDSSAHSSQREMGRLPYSCTRLVSSIRQPAAAAAPLSRAWGRSPD